MKITQLSALLTRVQQIAGDVDVVFKAGEEDAETVISDLGLHLNPTGNADGGKLTITHGPAPEAEPEGDNAAAGEAGSAEAATT